MNRLSGLLIAALAASAALAVPVATATAAPVGPSAHTVALAEGPTDDPTDEAGSGFSWG